MSCRVAMLRMQDDGLLQLPPRNGKPYRRRTQLAEPEPLLQASSPKELGTLQLQLVSQHHDSHRNNEYIDRYHYLVYQPPNCATSSGPNNASSLCSALAPPPGPSSPATASSAGTPTNAADPSTWWSTTRVSSSCPGSAAKTWHPASSAWPHDGSPTTWEPRYCVHPVLLETFVERPRFHGTCCQAANWTYLGDTQGRGKLDIHNQSLLPKKAIWVYPVNKRFRHILCR